MHLQDIILHSIACCLMSAAEAVYAGLERLICFLELLSGCIEELCVFLKHLREIVECGLHTFILSYQCVLSIALEYFVKAEYKRSHLAHCLIVLCLEAS